VFNGNVVKSIVFSQNFFSEMYTVYHSDRDCQVKLLGGGALLAVSEAVFAVERRPDLEFFKNVYG
jgi:hypothetical protein